MSAAWATLAVFQLCPPSPRSLKLFFQIGRVRQTKWALFATRNLEFPNNSCILYFLHIFYIWQHFSHMFSVLFVDVCRIGSNIRSNLRMAKSPRQKIGGKRDTKKCHCLLDVFKTQYPMNTNFISFSIKWSWQTKKMLEILTCLPLFTAFADIGL